MTAPPPRRPLALRRWLPWAGMGLAGLCMLTGMRMHTMAQGAGAYMGCQGCFDLPIALHDLRLLAALLGLLALAGLCRARWLRAALAVAALALVSLYAIDLGTLLIFGMRLKLDDLLRYSGDTGAAWSVALPLLGKPQGLWLLGGWLLACAGWAAALARLPASVRVAAPAALLAATLPWAALAQPARHYIAPEYYRDLLTNNLPGSVNKPYSAAMHARLRAQPAPPAACAPAPAGQTPRSLIVLVVESLSAYHSALLSGLGNSTPELDKLAQAHSYFPHFHANGFTTDGGLIALLTARAPLPAIGRYHSTHVYAGYEQAADPQLMPRLHAAGYQSGFFTTGDLGFLGKGDWLRALGFAHIEGHEHPAYARLPRGAFGDTGDNRLYARYLQWYDHERQPARPVFSVLLTVSTHPPFHVPGTAIQNEAQAFRWADAQLGRFVQALQARGYFRHGVLLITGDHRAMTFMQPGEPQRMGPAAASRVPAVVIGPAGLPPGPVPGHWQQTDLLAGVQALAGLPSCTDDFRGRLLGQAHAPAPYLLQVQGARRNHISVLTQAGQPQHEVLLNGDRTGWAGPAPSGPNAQAPIDHINRERARLSALPRNVMDLLLQGRTRQQP